jgi:hypothetical protein
MGRPLVSYYPVAEWSDVRIAFDDGKASDVGVPTRGALTAEFFLLAGVFGPLVIPPTRTPRAATILYVNFAGPGRGRGKWSKEALLQTPAPAR